MKYILSMKIDENEKLPYSAATGDLHGCQEAIKEGADVNTSDTNSNTTPLFWATYTGNYDVAEFLLQNGADVNLVNVNQVTPLHWLCCWRDDPAMAQLFLRYGADPHLGYSFSTPPYYATPLMNARLKPFPKQNLIKLLIVETTPAIKEILKKNGKYNGEFILSLTNDQQLNLESEQIRHFIQNGELSFDAALALCENQRSALEKGESIQVVCDVAVGELNALLEKGEIEKNIDEMLVFIHSKENPLKFFLLRYALSYLKNEPDSEFFGLLFAEIPEENRAGFAFQYQLYKATVHCDDQNRSDYCKKYDFSEITMLLGSIQEGETEQDIYVRFRKKSAYSMEHYLEFKTKSWAETIEQVIIPNLVWENVQEALSKSPIGQKLNKRNLEKLAKVIKLDAHTRSIHPKEIAKIAALLDENSRYTFAAAFLRACRGCNIAEIGYFVEILPFYKQIQFLELCIRNDKIADINNGFYPILKHINAERRFEFILKFPDQLASPLYCVRYLDDKQEASIIAGNGIDKIRNIYQLADILHYIPLETRCSYAEKVCDRLQADGEFKTYLKYEVAAINSNIIKIIAAIPPSDQLEFIQHVSDYLKIDDYMLCEIKKVLSEENQLTFINRYILFKLEEFLSEKLDLARKPSSTFFLDIHMISQISCRLKVLDFFSRRIPEISDQIETIKAALEKMAEGDKRLIGILKTHPEALVGIDENVSDRSELRSYLLSFVSHPKPSSLSIFQNSASGDEQGQYEKKHPGV